MIYIKIKNKILLSGFLFTIFFTLIPSLTFAASIYMTTDYQPISVGDTIIVNVIMDPVNDNPNVVEGDVLIKSGSENIKILELSTAGSILTYWARNPSLDNSNSKVSFIGGKPNGFNTSGSLFKIVFLAEKEGEVVFSPSNIKTYNNDGNATSIKVSVNSLAINVSPKNTITKNEWLEVISNDSQPPQQLSATIGQDDAIFNGKKFITISAIDNQSGIDYYNVKEGEWPLVRSGKTYVLLDQNELSNIIITAYDKAGNYSKIILRPAKVGINYALWLLILIIVLFIILFVFYKIKRK